jgi:maltooligosyltrehalose trehalohydrolase
MLFMGEEAGSVTPFLFFTDFHGELADAVREGRRREFAGSPGFSFDVSDSPVPDPNDAATYESSRWTDHIAAHDSQAWRDLVAELLNIRRERLVANLSGARALAAEAIGHKTVIAIWRLGNDATLTIAFNCAAEPVHVMVPPGDVLFGPGLEGDMLPGDSTTVWLAEV